LWRARRKDLKGSKWIELNEPPARYARETHNSSDNIKRPRRDGIRRQAKELKGETGGEKRGRKLVRVVTTFGQEVER